MLSRLKGAARILLKGEPQQRRSAGLPSITSEEVAEIKKFFPRDKFFIFGHARSGTTLLARLVRIHPEVHCNYQAHFFTRRPLLKSLVDTREAEEWLTRKSNRWNHGRDLSPLVLRAAADLIMERDAAREGKRIVGDKSPSSTIHGQAVRDLHAVYPDAKLAYIVRDGRDVLISERFRNFVEESRFLSREDRRIVDALRENDAPFSDGRRSIFSDAFLRRATLGWVANLTETEREARRLFGESCIAIRYEDLVVDPFTEVSRLWRFLNVAKIEKSLETEIETEMASNPDEQWQAERNESISSFLRKGQAGNWRQLFSAREKAVFKEIGGQMLVKWNYEKDFDW